MGHRQAAARQSDSSARGFYVNNPLVTSTFSAVFIQGCSQTCLSKAYYSKGFGAPTRLLLWAVTLHPPAGFEARKQMWPTACVTGDAKRQDKTWRRATERGGNECARSHPPRRHKLIGHARLARRTWEKSLSYQRPPECQNANQLACQHTSANGQTCFVSTLRGCNYITARRKRQSELPPPDSNNAATSLRGGVGLASHFLSTPRQM